MKGHHDLEDKETKPFSDIRENYNITGNSKIDSEKNNYGNPILGTFINNGLDKSPEQKT